MARVFLEKGVFDAGVTDLVEGWPVFDVVRPVRRQTQVQPGPFTSGALRRTKGVQRLPDLVLSFLIGCGIVRRHVEKGFLIIKTHDHGLAGLPRRARPGQAAPTDRISPKEDVQRVAGVLQTELEQQDELQQLNAKCCDVYRK